MILLIGGCGGGGSGGGDDDTDVHISGTVSAPDGALAFHQPTRLQYMAAMIFYGNAAAAIDGVTDVGAGVTVDLIQVDANGDQVGDVISSTTTDANGHYRLTAPADFSFGPDYVARATGTFEKLEARVIDKSLQINPISDTASKLVTMIADDLDLITAEEVEEIVEIVDDISMDVVPTGLNAAQLSAALIETVNNDIGASNLINAVVATGQICGYVEDVDGQPLAGIRIVARNFRSNALQNKAKTDVQGNYCMNVQDGDYIVGAINQTTASFAASEWWSDGGEAYTQLTAEKITVTGDSVIGDFVLEDGARIKGTVKAAAGGPLSAGSALENLKVTVQNFENFADVASMNVESDGSYTLNIIPGSYALSVLNTTSQLPYASEFYDGGAGSNDGNEAQRIDMDAGNKITVDLVLEPGHLISGQVLDDVAGNPVPGIRVRVNIADAGFSERVKTDNLGRYQLWVVPDVYELSAYGLQISPADVTTGNYTADFTGPVGTVTGVVQDGYGDPVDEAKIFLRAAADGSFINQEPSRSDGSFTLYSKVSGNHLVEIRIDDAQPYGSSIYLNQTRVLSGTAVAITLGANNNLGTVSLPTAGIGAGAGVLRGIVTESGNAVGNASVQIRDGGTSSEFRFVTSTTHGDGSYVVSLPAGTYERVRAVGPTGASFNVDSVTILDNNTTTQNFTLTP